MKFFYEVKFASRAKLLLSFSHKGANDLNIGC